MLLKLQAFVSFSESQSIQSCDIIQSLVVHVCMRYNIHSEKYIKHMYSLVNNQKANSCGDTSKSRNRAWSTLCTPPNQDSLLPSQNFVIIISWLAFESELSQKFSFSFPSQWLFLFSNTCILSIFLTIAPCITFLLAYHGHSFSKVYQY